eukprot:gene43108-52686_t
MSSSESFRGFEATNQPVITYPPLVECLPTLHLSDIGLNLSDPMFRGKYHGSEGHENDLDLVLQRARSCKVESALCTSTSCAETEHTFALIRTHQHRPLWLQATVGVHPSHCREFSRGVDATTDALRRLVTCGVREGLVSALGEMGLDYDRLHRCPKDLQLIGFEAQLRLARELAHLSLPLFLHSRNSGGDVVQILREHMPHLPAGGVVHCFTGDLEELRALLDLGLYVSLSALSLKTPEALAVVQEVPIERLLLETDAPYCQPRNSHASAPFLSTYFPPHPLRGR